MCKLSELRFLGLEDFRIPFIYSVVCFMIFYHPIKVRARKGLRAGVSFFIHFILLNFCFYCPIKLLVWGG